MVNSLALQRLGLCAFTAKGVGSILGQGSEILKVVWYGEKKKKEPQKTEMGNGSCGPAEHCGILS